MRVRMTRETQRRFVLPAPLLLLVLACVHAVNAQDPQPQPTPLTAPPPFKMIVKEERAQIDSSEDSSKRLKLTIQFAGAHLTAAEQHTTREHGPLSVNDLLCLFRRCLPSTTLIVKSHFFTLSYSRRIHESE